MKSLVVSLEHELQRVLGEERNPLAWLLAWRETEDGQTLVWRVEAVHPEVDLECNPVKIGDVKEYARMTLARRRDGLSVLVNLQLDFDIDPMKKELDYVDIAHAIKAARDCEAYRLDKMMRQISRPECLDKLVWIDRKDDLPEYGLPVIWDMESREKYYMWRSRFYEADDYCQMNLEKDEEGYLGVEDHGRKMVRRWAYLPNAKDVRGNDFWKDAEKEKPDAREWVLAVKSYTGPYDGGAIYYYEMSKYEEGKGWLKTEEGSKHEKTIWWARLPDLGW